MNNQSHKFIEAMQQHIDAEKLLQGATGKNGKGCFIYCSAGEYNHELMAKKIQWPLQLVYISEAIFEGLDVAGSQTFAVDILKAAKPNADLSLVHWKFLHWMIKDTLKKHSTPTTRKGCSKSLAVIRDLANGKKVTEKRALAAAWDAADVAAARPVWDSRAAWAIANVARATWAAWAVANVARDVVDPYAVKADKFEEFAEKLIEIMEKQL